MQKFNIKDFGTGCIESTFDARDYVLNEVALAIQLPDSFEVLHSKIKNQGNVGSCVAHSVCEVLEAANKNCEQYSTNWIYGYRPEGYYIGPGMMARQACQTIVEKGFVPYDSFPGNTEMLAVMRQCKDKQGELLKIAAERKAIAYNRLKTKEQIKEAIYTSGLPVIIVIRLTNEIELDENNIMQYDGSEGGGCHCMVCYGWNELGLLIQNSWGRIWGDNGTFILPEEYPFAEAWAISYDADTNISSKPKMWWLRNLIQKIIKLFRKN